MIKSFVKTSVRKTWPGMRPAVLVASMGRSGSTLVYDSLIDGMARLRFGSAAPRLRGAVRDEAWTLAESAFHRGRVYKTHDFPWGLAVGSEPRAVFLFGKASSAARSVLHCDMTRGRAWIEEHFVHLKAYGTIEDVPYRDVLRFGEQLDAWLSTEAVPVLALRYEDLWNVGAEALLGRFAGFPVRLPPRRARESAAHDFGEQDTRLARTYAALDAKIAALPPVHLNGQARALIEPFEAQGPGPASGAC